MSHLEVMVMTPHLSGSNSKDLCVYIFVFDIFIDDQVTNFWLAMVYNCVYSTIRTFGPVNFS